MAPKLLLGRQSHDRTDNLKLCRRSPFVLLSNVHKNIFSLNRQKSKNILPGPEKKNNILIKIKRVYFNIWSLFENHFTIVEL